MNLLIIGAPGTGKGTMSNLIIKDYEVAHVSTGDMLRAAISAQTEVGLLAKSYMDKGQLVPDETIHNVITEYFDNNKSKSGFLFDGYPRTVKQAEDFDGILKSEGMILDKVICLSLDDEVLKNRITGRRVCPDCKEIYHITNKPSKVEGTCDVCGGHEFYQRDDDKLATFKNRLDVNIKLNTPLVDYYQKQGVLHTIDGQQDIDKVYDDVKKVLNNL